jgi:hypothetical protein
MDKYKEFSDHKIGLRFFMTRDIRDAAGKKIKIPGYEEFETPKGRIESSLWYEQAYRLIEKYNEIQILEDIKNHVKLHCAWLREAVEEQITKYALELHIARIYENPEWVGYEEFKRRNQKSEQLSLF